MLTFFKRLFSSGTVKPAGKKLRWEPIKCDLCNETGLVGDHLTGEWFCYPHALKHFENIETIPSLAAILKMHEEWNSETK